MARLEFLFPKNDCWRADIAGLYTLKFGDQPIHLIELSIAKADIAPVVDTSGIGEKTPKMGCWFKALKHIGEVNPDPDRFAACCFPASYPDSGRLTFIIDETGVLYEKDCGSGGLTVYPANPLNEGWAVSK